MDVSIDEEDIKEGLEIELPKGHSVDCKEELENKDFKDDQCENSFSQSCNFNNLKQTHTGVKPFKCDLCEKSFSQSQNLNKHKQSHKGMKPYKCDLCKISISQSGNLNKHKSTHTGVKLFK